MKSLAQARLKRARAVGLVADGKSYTEVAEAVGYRHRGSAHRAVFQALAEREMEAVDDLRALELARIDSRPHCGTRRCPVTPERSCRS